MTVREYLSQVYLLEQRIACDTRLVKQARALADSISSPRADRERVCTSPAREAPFVRALERAEAMEEKIAAELNLLLSLKEQTDRMIGSLPTEDMRLILILRYMEHKQWPEIADMLNISRNTARARHDTALSRLVLPDHPVDIRNDPADTVFPAPVT